MCGISFHEMMDIAKVAKEVALFTCNPVPVSPYNDYAIIFPIYLSSLHAMTGPAETAWMGAKYIVSDLRSAGVDRSVSDEVAGSVQLKQCGLQTV